MKACEQVDCERRSTGRNAMLRNEARETRDIVGEWTQPKGSKDNQSEGDRIDFEEIHRKNTEQSGESRKE
jgi:predicted RecB family nuclease